MKTHVTKESEIQRAWHVVDAQGVVLGRLASEVAALLRGKHKPNYSSHLDTGDHVIIVNADQVVLTGRKLEQKMYHRHSGLSRVASGRSPTATGWPSSPTEVVRKAVKGMLPRTRLGRQMLTKVRIYSGPEHPHVAQGPAAV